MAVDDVSVTCYEMPPLPPLPPPFPPGAAPPPLAQNFGDSHHILFGGYASRQQHKRSTQHPAPTRTARPPRPSPDPVCHRASRRWIYRTLVSPGCASCQTPLVCANQFTVPESGYELAPDDDAAVVSALTAFSWQTHFLHFPSAPGALWDPWCPVQPWPSGAIMAVRRTWMYGSLVPFKSLKGSI